MQKKNPQPLSSESRNFIVSEKDANERLDRFLQKKLSDYSRTDIQKLIAENQVTVAGSPAKKNLRLSEGMLVCVASLPQKESSSLEPEKMDLHIVYEDDDVAVIFTKK